MLEKKVQIVFRIIFILSLVPILNIKSSADDRSNAKGLGMSTACVVSSTGLDAYGINPANYYFRRREPKIEINSAAYKLKQSTKEQYNSANKPLWQISIANLGGGYGSDKSLDFYTTYLNYLSIRRETFANRFLNLDSVFNFRQNVLPDKNTQVNYDFELKWLSLTYQTPKTGAINFTISDKVGLNTNVLNKDESFPYPSIRYGTGGSYDILNADLHLAEAIAWWIRKYTIGYAQQYQNEGFIKNFTVGFSASLVHGFGNVIIYNSGIKMDTYGIRRDQTGNHIDSVKGKQNFYSLQSLTGLFQDYIDGAETHFNFFPRPAGKGYSFDIGINLQLGENVWIAASVTELGFIKWDYNTLINKDTNDFYYENFYVLTEDPVYNQFVNDLDGLDTRYTGQPYKTDMPTKYRAGIMFKPTEELSVELDWMKGLNDLPSNSTRDKVSLGAEYYVTDKIPLRTGISIGGYESFNFSVGAGYTYKNFTVDIASSNMNVLWNQFTEINRLSLTISSKLIF
jgi:hypothetical protein